jgi:hypothetical protein
MMPEAHSTYRRQVFLFPLACIFLFVGLLGFEHVLPYRNTNDYIFAFLDKLNMLKAEAGEPRIILLGGSNLALGIDSHELEKALHKRVINMGVQVGFGMKFIMDSARPYFRKGDIVVLSFEYNNYFGDIFYGDYGLLCLLESVYPEGIKYINASQSCVLLGNVNNFIIDSLKRKLRYFIVKDDKLSSCYDRRAFNEYGDVVFHLTDKNQNHAFAVAGPSNSGFRRETLDFLDKYKSDLGRRGVRVLFLYPSIQKSTYVNQLANIREVEKQLKPRAINADILITPEDAVYADNLFYDSPYHLNRVGRSIRTEQLISLLQEKLSDK